MKINPPKRPLQFLRWFCREDYLEEIEGDLTEVFKKHSVTSPRKAKWKFCWSVIKYLRPEFISIFKATSPLNPIDMFHHNLLITYRNFLRYKSSFFINLIGLSSGLTAVLLIYLWVHDEMSFDKFHEKNDRLFQVMRHTPDPALGVETHGSNSVLLPSAIENEMPDVEYVLPVRPTPPGIISAEKEKVKASGWFVGKYFFNVFSYELLQGDYNTVLREKYAVVVSEELAFKLFGTIDNCVGKAIIWELDHFGGTHIISGVFKTPKENTSEKFDFLLTHELFLEKNRMDVSWDSNPIFTYLTLKPGVNIDEFNSKLNTFYHSKRETDSEMFIKRYSDQYLYGRYENGIVAGGRIDYVILFSIIALFILIIACINFMNLCTARASRRVKEVGIKKVIGALRRSLIVQHLSESMLMAILSLIVSVLMIITLLPQFNLITGKQMVLTLDWKLISGACIIVIFTGLVAGSYPAFYLSRYKPVDVLKGRQTTSSGELWARNGLVIFQFSVSILLIMAVAIVYTQLNFLQTKNLGYNKANTITFEIQGALSQNLESFLTEIRNIPGVVNASSVRGDITNINSTSWGHTWEGQTKTDEIKFTGATTNYNFIETLGISLKEGRSFSRDFGNEESTVILNEAAVETMQLANPVGKWMNLFGAKREIVGIVNDFHFQSMYEEIKPMFMICNPQYTDKVLVNIQAGAERETIAKLNRILHQFNPGVPFETTFLDDEYNALYVSEQRIAVLSKCFASIGVVISCLGLFGMAAFTAERRTKEIGIRKTLGASEWKIVQMLSRDFTAIVLLAVIVSLPTSYLLARSWLANFAYRIELEWWFFVGVGLVTILIAWFTIGIQTIKTARANPVDCLKRE